MTRLPDPSKLSTHLPPHTNAVEIPPSEWLARQDGDPRTRRNRRIWGVVLLVGASPFLIEWVGQIVAGWGR